ncbi:MAG: hypothetical protein M0P70_11125 [Desulfobulbaceae bacterium]|nr:hypothetical protein [Desulfobulbaceae bacterium]
MAGLNAILAKMYPTPVPAAGDVAGRSLPAAQQSPADEERDQFLVGRHWQNRAGGEGSLAGAGFRGGNHAAYGARVYAGQAMAQASDAAAGAPAGAEEAAEGEAAGTASVADEQEPAADTAQAAAPGSSPSKGVNGEPLNPAEVAQLAELKKADTAVRAHEQAHLAAAGGLAKGGASFTYQKGPDGRNYAVGGEVQIDTSQGATPEETVGKMMRVRAAALAPANPSPQDRKVAQAAAVTISEARLELNTQGMRPEEQREGTQEGTAAEKAEGETGDNASATPADGTAVDSRKSAVAARAASRYLATAKGQGVFHLAV